MKSSSILDHVPIEDLVHKENTIKPGPWNSGNKRGPLIAPTVKAGFKSKNDDKICQIKTARKVMCEENFLIYFQFTRTRMMIVIWRKLNYFQIMYVFLMVVNIMTV